MLVKSECLWMLHVVGIYRSSVGPVRPRISERHGWECAHHCQRVDDMLVQRLLVRGITH
jgi:hypothetical protein